MNKSEETTSLQTNTNTSFIGVEIHADRLDNDSTIKIDSNSIPEEAGDTTISSASSSFSIIYGILSEIDRKCQYIKIKTNTTENTYYIQNSLFNPNSSIPLHTQFYSIIPLSLLSEYVAVYLDSSNKVLGIERFISQKTRAQLNIPKFNPLEPTYFPDKPVEPEPIKSESEDTTISSDSDFFSFLFDEYDEPEPDLLIENPLYPSYQNMPNYIPASIKPENFLKYNYVFNAKVNSKHSNAFFIREVCYILSQPLLGDAFLISAVAPTKMTHSKFLLIKSSYELLNSLYNKTQKILNTDAKKQQLAYLFYNLQYITEGHGFYEHSYNAFIKQYQSDKSLSQNLPNRQTLIQQIKDYSQQLSTLLNRAKHNYEIALKYKSKFNEEPYGELHLHGFLPDLYNFEQNCNYDYKFDKYGRKIYIIPINYTYKGSLRSSKVELCIQPIDSKRYAGGKLKSIENLLNYFYGPQNQPTFYFSTQTFNNYNGSSVLRNISTTQLQFKANNQTIDCIKYKPTLLQCYSNQIPTFNLPGDPNDHTLFDFWPELAPTLDKLFPNLYNKFPEIFPDPKSANHPKSDFSTASKPDIPLASKIFNRYIYQYNAGYISLFNTFPKSPEECNEENVSKLIPTIYRLPEISSTAKRLYLFILSHFFVNNYSAFTQLKSSTTLLANSNPENNIYKIAHSTIPSLHTLADYIQIAENKYGKSIHIHPSPDETLAEAPAQYWQLFSGLDEFFEPLSTVQEMEANLSQHNKLCLHATAINRTRCLEASRTLQNQFSLSTNIFTHIQPENGLEHVLEPLNAKSSNSLQTDFLSFSSRLTLFSQIYKNSSYSSFSLISHKTNQICIKIHQNFQNYEIPYIDDS